MNKFHEQLLHQHQHLWNAMLNHPFLKKTAEGTIEDKTFKTWMRQDYIFVREAIPFMAVLLAKAPVEMRSMFVQIITGLEKELELFHKNAEAHGINLDNIEAAPTCHAYIQFLMNVAYNNSFEEGFTVLYTAEKAYMDSWMAVKENLKGDSPWREFINNWTSEAFQQYVDWLAATLDEMAQGEPEQDLAKMEQLFKLTTRYEYNFWEMANKEEDWAV